LCFALGKGDHVPMPTGRASAGDVEERITSERVRDVTQPRSRPENDGLIFPDQGIAMRAAIKANNAASARVGQSKKKPGRFIAF
jgi:hypothetical protein